MKRKPYLSLWLLLGVALVAVVVVSFIDGDITIGSWTVKKAPFKEKLLGIASPEEQAYEEIAFEEVEAVVAEVDTVPQTFLILGDSMTMRLAYRLADYAEQNGHNQVHAVNWDSSTTPAWAESDKIETYMAQFHPTFIFVCLGSNESFLADPSVRRPDVEKIIAKFGNTPFLWIGPPNLGRKTKYNDFIASVVGANRFFLSDGLTLERGGDHIHPNQAASNEWMDSVMRWIPKSVHPFRAEKPAPGVKGKLDYHWFGPDRPAKTDTVATDTDAVTEIPDPEVEIIDEHPADPQPQPEPEPEPEPAEE